jgi:hypothetical protein
MCGCATGCRHFPPHFLPFFFPSACRSLAKARDAARNVPETFLALALALSINRRRAPIRTDRLTRWGRWGERIYDYTSEFAIAMTRRATRGRPRRNERSRDTTLAISARDLEFEPRHRALSAFLGCLRVHRAHASSERRIQSREGCRPRLSARTRFRRCCAINRSPGAIIEGCTGQRIYSGEKVDDER